MVTPPSSGPPAGRLAGALLIAGPAIFFLAEFVAAAAWTNPPYSYTYHYISNLGVRGPSVAGGQYLYSPLAWVMNTGFFLFGFTVLAGVALLRGLPRLRHGVMLVTAALMAAGGVLLAFFPGSGEAMDDGTAAHHGWGAFAAIIGGNVLVILLGTAYPRDRLLVALGVLGLVAMAAFMSITSETFGLIGLVERAAVYPYLIGLIRAGAALRKRRTRQLPDA